MSPTHSSKDLDLCRLKDQREVTRYQYWTPLVPGEDYSTRNVDEERGVVGVNAHYWTGFSISSDVIPSVGTATFTLLAIDFSDAVGSKAQLDQAREVAGEVSAWFEKMSQGRFKINWRFGDRVFRIPSPSTSFGLQTAAHTARPLAVEIIEVVDPYFDFTGVDAMWTLPPSTITTIGKHFHRPLQPDQPGSRNSSGDIWSDEGPIRTWGGPGMVPHQPHNDLWAYFVHESFHSMGIADTYLGNKHEKGTTYDTPTGTQPMHHWSIMSAQDGASQTLIAWHRFLLGWLDDDQVHCVPAESLTASEVTLVPTLRELDGLKTVMIPVSDSKVIVVESRRQEGYDSGIGNIALPSVDQDGITRRTFLKDFGTNGLIVYTYDTSVMDLNGQARLQVPEGRVSELGWASCSWLTECTWFNPDEDPASQGQRLDPNQPNSILVPVAYDPLLREGDSVTVEGITIKLVQSGQYDRVRISR